MLFKIKGIEFVLFICRVYFESKKKKERSQKKKVSEIIQYNEKKSFNKWNLINEMNEKKTKTKNKLKNKMNLNVNVLFTKYFFNENININFSIFCTNIIN